MRFSPTHRVLLGAAILLALGGCDGTEAPAGLRRTPTGPGVRLSWTPTGLGVPTIPFPNDVLTRPDPASPTGLRLSFPRDSRTIFEDELRAALNDLDGFGGVGPILVPFDSPIDVVELRRRQGPSDAFTETRFTDHAIYLVDLTTGLPIPIGLGAPWTPDALVRPDGHHPTDPRAGEPSLLLETVDEAGRETDFDGVDDRPATVDGEGGGGAELVDRITGEWERETNTLIARPLLPLSAGGRYAVVVTERLRGAMGESVRSPLTFVHPPAQTEALRPLSSFFAEHPELYGDLAERGFEGVAFAWTFTVQSTSEDLPALARGLEGEGPFAALSTDFPPVIVPHPVSGGLPGRPCADPGAQRYRAPASVFLGALDATATQLSLNVADREGLLASYEALDSVVAFAFEVPHLLGDPMRPSPISRFRVDRRSGDARIRRDTVVAIAFIPRATRDRSAPFTPLLWLHDARGSKVDALAYVGMLLRHGVAPVVIDAPEHGLGVGDETRIALLNAFGNRCLAPLGEALLDDRSADFDGDDRLDPGAAAHGPDPFHARDLRRQAALDHAVLARVLGTLDGRLGGSASVDITGRRDPLSFDGDYDRDGSVDPIGDWDGDGIPDFGGDVLIAGIGMGANVAAIARASSSRITAASLVSPSGGLAQAFMRSGDERIRAGALRAAMGPVVWTRRSAGPSPSTACASGDASLRMTLADLDRSRDTELACISGTDVTEGSVLIVRDLTNGARGCAALDPNGQTHIPFEADSGDRFTVELHAPPIGVDFSTCEVRGGDRLPIAVFETFGVRSGPVSPGRCPECARFRRIEYELGSPLVVPAGGLGRRRQSPGLVRYETTLAAALHGADPLAYADALSVDEARVLITATAGDPVLPIAGAVRLARANGALAFLPAGAPPHLSRHATTPGRPTPHEALVTLHAIEGAAWLERTSVASGPRFLADPDDLAEGRARFGPDGSPSTSGAAPLRPSDPVRARLFTIAYVAPEGAHGPSASLLFAADTPFDASQYLINHVGRFLATDGREIRHRDAPMDHLCFADSSCDFLRE